MLGYTEYGLYVQEREGAQQGPNILWSRFQPFSIYLRFHVVHFLIFDTSNNTKVLYIILSDVSEPSKKKPTFLFPCINRMGDLNLYK